jgi:copper chaperone
VVSLVQPYPQGVHYVTFQEAIVTEKQYRVPEISCEHCVRAITNELASVPGVEVVNIDIPTKLVTLRHNADVTDEQIIATIAEAGYEVAA